MKLLIVEDEKKTGEYLTKGLTEAGFVVDLADNGLNGYHLASKVGGIKSPEIMSLCLLVNFCHFVWPLR